MGKAKISHIRLRKRLVQILKSHEGELPSAQALYRMVVESGMSPNLAGSHNRIAQICNITKGIGSLSTKITSVSGDSYTADVYYLESEDDFNEWVASKMG
tara:strand:+ start:322 stop:621 length:300 start_codon:yes stop_codon:yes gene_type:complete